MAAEVKFDQRTRRSGPRSKQDDGSIRSPSLSPARAEHSADQRRLAFRPMPSARSQRGTASLTLYGGGRHSRDALHCPASREWDDLAVEEVTLRASEKQHRLGALAAGR
jgi:hypothetical protein